MGSVVGTLANGVDAVISYGQKENITFFGTWAAAETWRMRFTSSVGAFTVGQALTTDGDPVLAGTTPTFGMTFSGRVYLANGKYLNFSANNQPTGWYEQDVGAGYIRILSQYGGQDSLVALAPYQGRLAVFLRNSIQIWLTNADPSLFQLVQPLANIGTNYKFSVQSLGDWDVLFLADSGVRSLRVRDSSLNAVTVDIGSPIDALIAAVIAAGSIGTPVSVVEPTSNRYWLFLKDTIYVLSLFQDSRIRAWSTYLPTVEDLGANLVSGSYGGVDGFLPVTGMTVGTAYYYTKGNSTSFEMTGITTLTSSGWFVATQTTGTLYGTIGVASTAKVQPTIMAAFVPSKFVVYNGNVYCRANATLGGSAANWLLQYGGGYDTCQATVQTPFLSLKMPSTNKYADGVDIALTGSWSLYASMDQVTETFETIGELERATYDTGVVGFSAAGTHSAFKLITKADSAAAATLSSLTLIYWQGEIQ